jgi:hypothetical protein
MSDVTKVKVYPTCPYCDMDSALGGIIEIEPYAGKGRHLLCGSKIFVCEDCMKTFVAELEVDMDVYPYKISKYGDDAIIAAPPIPSKSAVFPPNPRDRQN